MKKKIVVSILLGLIIICIIKIGCCRNMENQFTNIGEHLTPLAMADGGNYPARVNDYFKFYGLDIDANNVEHIFGTFESGGYTLAGHIYKPAKYKATVFIAHGYFNHCGQLNHLIENLLKNDFAVACFDLPGHGLSSGPRCSIENFSEYSKALIDFTKATTTRVNGPYHFIGHSTGAVAYIDYALKNKDNVFDKVVLAAPLVHCVGWEPSKIGCNEKLQFIKSIPRVFRKNSSDADFLNFVKNIDPLQSKTMPLQWTRALHIWNDKIANLPPCEKELKIIQGTSDTTVDWQFNMKFLETKFTQVHVYMIENANHELFNESSDMRSDVFSLIIDYLNNN